MKWDIIRKTAWNQMRPRIEKQSHPYPAPVKIAEVSSTLNKNVLGRLINIVTIIITRRDSRSSGFFPRTHNENDFKNVMMDFTGYRTVTVSARNGSETHS